MFRDLSGIWQCEIPGLRVPMYLPGTLDENGIGFPDNPAGNRAFPALDTFDF